MAELSRYDVSDKEAGIENGILKNKLGIKNQKKLEDAETVLLADTYTHFFDLLEKRKLNLDISLLFTINKYFLGTLYPWAGKVRTIDVSKDGMLFASVKYIDDSLKSFEAMLKKNIPTGRDGKKKVAQKLAIIHNECNAIHPFREGNGRTVRLFLDLTAGSLGYNPINWRKNQRIEYIQACIDGMAREHKSMEKIIFEGLTKKVG
ncbi:Fic family protein [Patescibacteria group bacterium]|nr:Fic family protein [Patescibacteria group bacterium]